MKVRKNANRKIRLIRRVKLVTTLKHPAVGEQEQL
jgi:hypothetical protein